MAEDEEDGDQIGPMNAGQLQQMIQNNPGMVNQLQQLGQLQQQGQLNIAGQINAPVVIGGRLRDVLPIDEMVNAQGVNMAQIVVPNENAVPNENDENDAPDANMDEDMR
jgi:hypothetical protein